MCHGRGVYSFLLFLLALLTDGWLSLALVFPAPPQRVDAVVAALEGRSGLEGFELDDSRQPAGSAYPSRPLSCVCGSLTERYIP